METNLFSETPVLDCPYCGNLATHKKLFEYETYEEIDLEKGEKEKSKITWMMYACITCDRVSLYGNSDLNDNFRRCYPVNKTHYWYAPDNINTLYAEGQKLKFKSGLAFVIIMRKLIEEICFEKKAEWKTLFAKIESLRQKYNLPNEIFDSLEIIRSVGNAGAHESEIDYSKTFLNSANYFVDVIIEFVYVIPEKIKAFKKSMTKNGS